jgi:hypothetical protein
MKQLLIISIILLLSGCATPGVSIPEFRKELANKKDWPKETTYDFIEGNIKLGMTKEQILWLAGSPLYWTKYPTKEGIFESWFYQDVSFATAAKKVTSFDFKDNILIGYNYRGKYYSKEYPEDIRNYTK